jgi:cytochrome c peroxidase
MRRKVAAFAVFAAALSAIVGVAAGPQWHWHLPKPVSPPPVPADNPMSVAKVELGRRLFYEADLSADGTLACAGCHEQHHGFTDRNRSHPGVTGEPGRRNVMGLTNVAYLTPLTFADDRQASLEAQLSVPLFGTHPVEMGMAGKQAEIPRRLGASACYRRLFAAAFPGDGAIDLPHVASDCRV